MLRNFVNVNYVCEGKMLEIICVITDISDQRSKDSLQDGFLIQPFRRTGRMLLEVAKCIMCIEVLWGNNLSAYATRKKRAFRYE